MKMRWVQRVIPSNILEPIPQEIKLFQRYYGVGVVVIDQDQIPVLRGMHHAFQQFIDRSRFFVDLAEIITANGEINIGPYAD